MHLDAALTEVLYAKDWIPVSRRWYLARLTHFLERAKQADVIEMEDVTASLVRRYIDYLGPGPLWPVPQMDSHTLHGHVRAIRAWLYWAASEDVIDEKVAKRIALPKREQKVLAILSPTRLCA